MVYSAFRFPAVSYRSLFRSRNSAPYIQLGGKILYRESDIQKILMANYREAYRMKGL